MSVKFYLVAVGLACVLFSFSNAAHIFDLFSAEDDASGNEREHTSRLCLCKGAACVCCLDFNYTLIDIGGPGCVHLKYLSQEEGFAVNISYGKQNLHSAVLKGSNPAPICLNIFSKLAEMCVRVNDLAPTAEGLRGCLQFEPVVLGVSQLEFPVGCFRSGPTGMEMEPTKDEPETTDKPAPEEETEEDGADYGLTAESFLQVVNQSAEQGILLFSNLLGLAGNKTATVQATTPKTDINNASTNTSDNIAVARRRVKQLIHPNNI